MSYFSRIFVAAAPRRKLQAHFRLIGNPVPLSRVIRALILVAVLDGAPTRVAAGFLNPPLQSPVASADLDSAAFSQWNDGAETAVEVKDGPRHVLWTSDSQVEWDGVKFGASKIPGVRHLRIGFTRSIAVGTILARGGVRVDVLKADAKYPGNLSDDAQWIVARRLANPTAAEPPAVTESESPADDYTFWVLPPGTETRAIRFTHIASPSDPDYAGWLGGAAILKDRYANIATQGDIVTGSNAPASARVNDGKAQSWDQWDNGNEGGPAVVSNAHPEFVTLIWPTDVDVAGLCALWAGFSSADVQVYCGPADRHPRGAAASDWKRIGTFDGIQNQYPRALGPNWMDLQIPSRTRAVRLQITRATEESHPHLKDSTKGGKRVWLGELLALTPLKDQPLEKAILPAPPKDHPPIPVKFTLKEAGFVTLVIEDSSSLRVRNLISETWFPAGESIVWWDGTDDLARDPQAAEHGIYHVPGAFVKPGSYHVRGLARGKVDLKYEMTVYNPGTPPWPTADHAGGWLADHTPPSAALFLPAEASSKDAVTRQDRILISSHVAEGGDGLVYLDRAGRKLGGIHWIGGNWTGASHLARDAGPKAVPGVYAYTGAAWEPDDNPGGQVQNKRGEVRLMQITESGVHVVLKKAYADRKLAELGGLTVRNGAMAATNPATKKLLFINAAEGQFEGEMSIDDPRGVAFEKDGMLLVLSGKRLLRYNPTVRASSDVGTIELGAPANVITTGLDDPQQIALDDAGDIYITDRGDSHQVKSFTRDGKSLKTFGTPGRPRAGLYDPHHMNNPGGITVDGKNVWVAETDFQPKRVSVWTMNGDFVTAFYGPPQYGGGGFLDPKDKSRFYYNGMEFKLDWEKHTNQLASVYYRLGDNELKFSHAYNEAPPEMPIYVNGRQYLTNCFNWSPTNGAPIAFTWMVRDHRAVPVAGAGRAGEWDELKGEAYKSRLPDGVDLSTERGGNDVLFAWSDLNDDGKPEPNEVTFLKTPVSSVTLQRDLSWVTTFAQHIKPGGFTPGGAPIYDLAAAKVLVDGTQTPTSSGGDQALLDRDGRLVLTIAAKPFAPQSVGGALAGKSTWSYPSVWPGLHASHTAPLPDRPGELIGTTRLLGHTVTPRDSDAGEIWAVNGNKGNIYLFTTDGLFVATLFKDGRRAGWAMPAATPGMDVTDASINEEDFWPSITQTEDGQIYLTAGVQTTCTIVRIDGLSTARRLSGNDLTVTSDQLAVCSQYFVQQEARRIDRAGRESLKVAILSKDRAPKIDGKLDDWANAAWVTIDSRNQQQGDWGHVEQSSRAALAISGDRLFAAFQTGEPDLLRNSGEAPQLLFKSGGALDIQVGADASAPPDRSSPVAGDVRLLVSIVKDKPIAILYRAIVPGTKEPVAFRSPWRNVNFDVVEDVSSKIELSHDAGTYEISIPLATLGLKPEILKAGATLRGDVGLLRGNGFQTLERVYWQNKATNLTADIPGEAMLTPNLWGKWEFPEER